MVGILKKLGKIFLIGITRYFLGVLFLLMSLSSFSLHGGIAGLLFLIAAIITIPPAANQLEKKMNVSMPGIAQFFIAFLLVATAFAAFPVVPDATNNSTNNTGTIATPQSTINGSEIVAVPAESTPVTVPTSKPSPKATSTPTERPAPTLENKGKLDIFTKPSGATITVDGDSKGLSPIEGLSVDAGIHSVVVYLSGYEPQKERVEITNSETKKLFYTLLPETNPTPISSTREETPTSEVTQTIEYDSSLVKNYEIVQVEDISMKALVRPLSTYTSDELDSLPLNVRKVYAVVISPSISKEELKSTLIQVVINETSKNNDIDEINVFAYDRKEEVNYGYNLGKVSWCPNGDWDSVTPEIASSNDRSSYKYIFDIKDKVGNIDSSERPTEREYEIYDYFNKCYDAALKNIDLNDPHAIVDEDLIMKKVAEKYGITEEEANEICTKVGIYNTK